MNPLRTVRRWWTGHGTRILGVIQGSIAVAAAVPDFIPAEWLKYALGVSALLTYWRGQVNANNLAPPPAGG